MADIIDFALERAKRKSGLNCSITLKDMLEEGYDDVKIEEVNYE